ncbi:hypothetical protein [Sorangium sp. So ce1151]
MADPFKKSIRRFLTKSGSDPGVIPASDKANGSLSGWREWDTPALD